MEFLDVVDENDNVIGKASKEDVYKNKLRHRIVHIMIFNGKGELALQLRSKNVHFCPRHWSTAVGGHVRSGETSEEAALRECEEELGVKVEIEFLSKDLYRVEGVPEKFLITFTAKYEGPFNINPSAVERADFFSLSSVQEMIDKGEKFHPELLFILRKHFGIK